MSWKARDWFICAGCALAGTFVPMLLKVPLNRRVDLAGVGLLSGILALAGFLATARSFLILKLHEDIYSTDAYQRRIRQLDGPNADIYRPLLCFDSKIAQCLGSCAVSVLMLLASALAYQWQLKGISVSDLALGAVLTTSVLFVQTVFSMNRNFRAIIEEWNAAAKNAPKQEVLFPENRRFVIDRIEGTRIFVTEVSGHEPIRG